MTTEPTPMTRYPPSHGRRARRALTVGAPILAATVLALHPENPLQIDGPWHPWYLVHYGILLLTPLLGAAAYLAMVQVPGRLARTAQWALLPFLVFYPAWEALAGVGTGRLVELTADMPTTGGATPQLVFDWFAWADGHWLAVAGIAPWLVFAIGGAIAHRRAGSGTAVVIGLAGAAAYPILHGGLPAALPLLLLAFVGWVQTRPPTPAAARHGAARRTSEAVR